MENPLSSAYELRGIEIFPSIYLFRKNEVADKLGKCSKIG